MILHEGYIPLPACQDIDTYEGALRPLPPHAATLAPLRHIRRHTFIRHYAIIDGEIRHSAVADTAADMMLRLRRRYAVAICCQGEG